MLNDEQRKMVMENLDMVELYAKMYTHKFKNYFTVYSQEDFRSAGYEGLIDAVIKLRTADNIIGYLKTRIKGAMVDHARNQKFSKFRRSKVRNNEVFLFSQLSEKLCKTIADHQVIHVEMEDYIDKIRALSKAAKIIDALTPKQRIIIRLFYGLGMRGIDVAKFYGVTESAVNQTKYKALKHLENGLRA